MAKARGGPADWLAALDRAIAKTPALPGTRNWVEPFALRENFALELMAIEADE